MKLAIALATRGRPALLLDTLTKTLPNVSLDDTKITVMVDDDDIDTIGCLSSHMEWFKGKVAVSIKEREDTVAEKFNRILSEPADLYVAMVDHTPYVTPEFDKKLLAAAETFPDGIGVVVNYMANASFTGIYAVTPKMAEKLGYFFPPYFPYWFVDHWLDDVMRMTGRYAVADVVSDSSKKPMTQEMREPGWWATFFDAAYLMRRKQAHTILWDKDLVAPHLHKKMIESQYPLVEFRSRWVNESVRNQAPALQNASRLSLNDERYQRIRAKAVAMLQHLLDDYGMAANEAAMFRNYLTPPTNIVNLKRAFA